MEKINSFEFVLPTRIRFGQGVSGEIADEIKKMGHARPFVITDKGLIRAGIVSKITETFEKYGMEYAVFDEIEPNPRDITVQRAYERAGQFNADVLVAVGGGSSMDAAKAVGVLMVHGGRINDYEGLDKIEKPICDLVAVPTTAGTGSEVTFWSVITDTKRHFKMSIGSPLMAAKLALVDPVLIESLPSSMVAATGMDALTHAIEGYTCTAAEPITDACGIYAIRMIAENIRAAAEGSEKEARAKMLLGSLIAGICFGNSDIAGVHCMGEALGGLYDTPHGVSMAILLPYVMEYNYMTLPSKFIRIAEAMGEDVAGMSEEEAAYASVKAVRKLNEDLKMASLKEIGTKEEDLPELARRAVANVSVESNPRKLTEPDFLDIFQKAYAQR